MRIAIFGAGAVGGYFGGRLAQVGEEVTFIARGAHLQAIPCHGLRVDSLQGDFVVRPAQATDDPTRVGVALASPHLSVRVGVGEGVSRAVCFTLLFRGGRDREGR